MDKELLFAGGRGTRTSSITATTGHPEEVHARDSVHLMCLDLPFNPNCSGNILLKKPDGSAGLLECTRLMLSENARPRVRAIRQSRSDSVSPSVRPVVSPQEERPYGSRGTL